MTSNEVYSYRVKNNYDAIVKDLEPLKIMPILFSNGVLQDYDDMDDVRSERTRKKQSEKLLSMIDKRGPNAWVIFIEALKYSPQSHLAVYLNTPVDGEELLIQERNARDVRLQELQAPFNRLDVQYPGVKLSVPVENNQPPCGNDPFVRASSKSHFTEDVNPDSPFVYRMKSNPRGKALIINNKTFRQDTTKKLDERDGSDEDVSNLEKLFGPDGLNFEVNIQENLTADEIEKLLAETARLQSHCDYDCFVLFLMSHGESGFVYGIDGKSFEIKKISDIFTSTRCIPLMNKPKLFFIQSCRGEDSEMGMIIKDSPSTEEEKEENSFTGIQFDFHKKKTHPDYADMLFAFASVEGFAAHRHREKGSWFVNDVVEVFKQYACNKDVLKMLTIVNKRVSERGDIGKKQVPEPKSTLTKDVYFWPGLFKDPDQ